MICLGFYNLLVVKEGLEVRVFEFWGGFVMDGLCDCGKLFVFCCFIVFLFIVGFAGIFIR